MSWREEMSWRWKVKYQLLGWAYLVPNLKHYPDMTEKWAIGKLIKFKGQDTWSVYWIKN